MELINQPQARRVAAIWRIYLVDGLEVDVYELAPLGPKSDDTRRQLDTLVIQGTSSRGMTKFYECTNFDESNEMSSDHEWYAPRVQDRVYISPTHVKCLKPLRFNDVADVQDVVR